MDVYKNEGVEVIESASEKPKKIGYEVEPHEVESVIQMIIAMKGDAFTGKTTCANAIAKYYRCSVIRFDSILDSLSTSSPRTPSPEEAARLAELAFDVILRVARLQLVMWRPVVIDSPLDKPSHLDKLLRLADELQSCGNESCKKWHCKVAIVECRPEAKDAWQLRFKKRDQQVTEKWYKPKEWSDVVQQCSRPVERDYSPRQLPSYVSRLIVDTTSQCVNERNLGPATYDLCSCMYDLGHDINFKNWLPGRPLHTNIITTRINSSQDVGKESIGETLKKIVGEHEGPTNFRPIVIAMKGDAYTGKTTCAAAISKSYKCALISFDDILDSISQSPPGSPQEVDRLVDLAFDIILRIVKRQLGLGHPVVIDSPLNKATHLYQLLGLIDELKSRSSSGHQPCDTLHSGRFVIVECRPEAKYAWQLKFQKRNRQATDKWYKPKEWDDVVQSESVEDYPQGKLPNYVCRLIVDTTRHVNYRYLGPATLDLCWCPRGHLFHFQNWLPNAHQFHPELNFNFLDIKSVAPSSKLGDNEKAMVDVKCGNDAWHFWEETKNLQNAATNSIGDKRFCGACQVPISYPDLAYTCRLCPLALHKSCAELQEKTMIPPHQLPRFLRIISSPVSADDYYSYIPEEYRQIMCDTCRVVGKDFSVNCKFCLWETHLRSGLIPTILHHEGHSRDHFMYFWITPTVNPLEYQCDACKLPGSCVGYTCESSGFRFNVHVECALLARPMSHIHGGHEHDMHLVLGTDEIQEDYICDVCLEPRDSTAWYYYCDMCVFASHLHCIYA